MQPQQPAPQPPANYDFILNPNQPPRRPRFSGGNSMATRLLIVLGGLFVLVIVAAIFINFLGSSGSSNKTALLTIAQDQTELIRLANRGKQDSVSQINKNVSATTALSLKSDNATLLAYSAKHGVKPDEKALVVTRSTNNNSQLDSAKSASTFDPAYRELLKSELTRYQQDLSKAYNDTKSTEGKATLRKLYVNSTLLLQQLNS